MIASGPAVKPQEVTVLPLKDTAAPLTTIAEFRPVKMLVVTVEPVPPDNTIPTPLLEEAATPMKVAPLMVILLALVIPVPVPATLNVQPVTMVVTGALRPTAPFATVKVSP